MRKLRRLPKAAIAFLRELNALGWVVLIVFIIVVGGIVGGTSRFAWHHFHHVNEEQVIINKVGKLVQLPQGETPVITKVEDKTQVTQQFLAKAENGDRVLLYPQARVAYVYRPSTNKIINVGPFLTSLVPVFVRSGSATSNTPDVINQIKSQSVNFTVTSSDASPQQNYDKTLVIDLSGARSAAAEQLAELLHATISSLPKGESRPDADLLVIVGPAPVKNPAPAQ